MVTKPPFSRVENLQVVTTLLENGADIEVGHDLGDQRSMQDQFFHDCSVAKFPIYFLLAYCICIINTVCRYVEIVDIICVFKPLDGLYFVSIPPLAVKIDFF